MLPGVRVNEPHQVQAVLGMGGQLARDQLPNLAGSDDDGVLKIVEPPPGDAASERAAQRDERDRKNPQRDQLGRRDRLCLGEQPRHGKQQPNTGRDQMEHSHQVVDGRVVGALLVVVVQSCSFAHRIHTGSEATNSSISVPTEISPSGFRVWRYTNSTTRKAAVNPTRSAMAKARRTIHPRRCTRAVRLRCARISSVSSSTAAASSAANCPTGDSNAGLMASGPRRASAGTAVAHPPWVRRS